MPEVPINVALFTESKLKVTPSRGIAVLDEEPTLRWTPSGDLTIEYIGFAAPVGPGEEIGVPHEDPENPGEWIAEDRNQVKGLYTYTVYGKTGEGRVLSSDPEIENEGKSGDVVEEPPRGGARPRGGGAGGPSSR